jgi:Domain of unknown function (DUF222)
MSPTIAPTPTPTPAPTPTPMSASEVAKLSTERIMELFAESAAAMASLAGLVCLLGGELGRREGFRIDGATSLESWIVARTGVSTPTARAYSQVAERLFDLPHLSDALSAGRISFDKVRAVAGVATPESDAELAESATELSVRDLAELVRSARRPRAADTRSEQEARSLRCNDALRTVNAQLPQDAYVEVRNALEARAKQLGSDGETRWDQRLADAFVSLVRSGARPGSGTKSGSGSGTNSGPGTSSGSGPWSVSDSGSGGPPSPYTVVAHVPLEVLLDEDSELCGELERGGLVSADVVRRLACDAKLIIAVDDDVGHTMYEGRQVRTATPTQRREILRRDRHCRFPGCGHVLFWVPHHIKEWERDQGNTDIDTLCCLCAYHHHLIHSEGWSMSGDANAELTFVGPSGRVMTSRPSPLWTRVTGPAVRRAAAKGAARTEKGTEKDP